MTIRADDRSYRRGIVLGFTVAEVVLLLVFCLLLLFVPLLLSDAAQTRRPDADKPVTPSLATDRPERKPPATAATEPKPDIKRPDAVGSRVTPPQKPAAKPLPDDWIVATPDRDNEPVPPVVPGERTQTTGAAPSSKTPAQGTRVADSVPPPVVAIPLSAVCKRLGIPERECTPERANAALGPTPAHADRTDKSKPATDPLGRHNWPPIIKLKEADGEFFVVGKAEVSRTLDEKIRRDVVPLILEHANRFQTNVVEVVGHTDEQPIQASNTNLDASVFDVLAGKAPASRLRVSDNAGLGFARAVAIVQILRNDDRLKHLTILPLSAAQVVDQSGKLADGSSSGDVKERRRIEIRVRQGEPPN